MQQINRRCVIAARPTGLPKRSDFEFVNEALQPVGVGEFLVRTSHVSLDPAMLGWMSNMASYMPPVNLGDVMPALAVGEVVASKNEAYQPGTMVSGFFGVQEYALADGKDVTVVDADLAPAPVHLGRLGMPGLTAYFGLLDVGQAKKGDTVVISGAAGAVGTVAGQIARLRGCRVVGIAGGPAKCSYLTGELAFDAAIDYRNENVAAALHRLCPDGIDVYFDNVGGDILDAALVRLAPGARVVICGAISQYGSTTGIKGPANYLSLLMNRASMTGFLVFDFRDRYIDAMRDMTAWYEAGELTADEHIVDGLESFPDSLLMLFEGGNTGKLVLRIS